MILHLGQHQNKGVDIELDPKSLKVQMNPDLVLQNHQKEMMKIESLSTFNFYKSQLKKKNFNHNLFGILQNWRM